MQLLEWQIFDYDGRKTAIVFFSQCIILTLRPNKYVQKRRTFVEDSVPLLASFSWLEGYSLQSAPSGGAHRRCLSPSGLLRLDTHIWTFILCARLAHKQKCRCEDEKTKQVLGTNSHGNSGITLYCWWREHQPTTHFKGALRKQPSCLRWMNFVLAYRYRQNHPHSREMSFFNPLS